MYSSGRLSTCDELLTPCRVVNIAKIVLDNYSDTLTLDPELKEQIDLFVDVVSKVCSWFRRCSKLGNSRAWKLSAR